MPVVTKYILGNGWQSPETDQEMLQGTRDPSSPRYYMENSIQEERREKSTRDSQDTMAEDRVPLFPFLQSLQSPGEWGPSTETLVPTQTPHLIFYTQT